MHLFYLGNITDVPGQARNNNFYLFDLYNPEKVTWNTLTAEQLASSSLIPSTPSTGSNKAAIVGLSVGLGTLGIASIIVAFTLIYRRDRKSKNIDAIPSVASIIVA